MKVIAHRGASGYVPEHTLVAKGIAHAMGADYLEQDVVASKDQVPIVLHDIHIDTVTDVAKRYPDRKRDDGRYYAIDFTLEELKTLQVVERFDHRTGRIVFPQRYAGGGGGFEIRSLAEEIQFIQSLNRTSGRTAGIYPEVKQPKFHREEGCDLARRVIKILDQYGYRDQSSLCYLQCFDEFEVVRIRQELGYKGRLVQLIGSGHDPKSGTDFSRMKTAEGIADLAKVIDGIGPSLDGVVNWNDDGQAVITDLASLADQAGLKVHPWTVRADALPKNCESMDTMVKALLTAGVDGVFTDHPDQVISRLAD